MGQQPEHIIRMDHSSSVIPLELRLRALQHQILGSSESFDPPPVAGPSRPITRQLTDIQDTLDRIKHSSEALKRFLNHCGSGVVFHGTGI